MIDLNWGLAVRELIHLQMAHALQLPPLSASKTSSVHDVHIRLLSILSTESPEVDRTHTNALSLVEGRTYTYVRINRSEKGKNPVSASRQLHYMYDR